MDYPTAHALFGDAWAELIDRLEREGLSLSEIADLGAHAVAISALGAGVSREDLLQAVARSYDHVQRSMLEDARKMPPAKA